MHTTTLLKSHGNFYGRMMQIILHTTHSLKFCLGVHKGTKWNDHKGIEMNGVYLSMRKKGM